MVAARSLLWLWLLVLAGCAERPRCERNTNGCAAEPWGPVDAALAAKLQAALEAARNEQQLPGLAMAAAFRGTRQLWVSTSGHSLLEPATTWQPADEFRIGSVSKTFTGAVMMQLADEGRLSLEDPLEKWVPMTYSGPTLRHLLGNRSGIVSYNYVGSFDTSRAWTPPQLVSWAISHEPALRFTPGQKWEYSNTNFVLLGMVIEKATGQRYEAVLKERLFGPLRLEHTRLAHSKEDAPPLVHGYEGTPPVDSSSRLDPSFAWSAGGIVSTPADLASWTVALYGGHLLSPTALTEMVTKSGETPAGQEDYGLATQLQAGDGHTLEGHTGGIGGYSTYAFFLEPEGVAVVMMSNRNPTDLKAASQHIFRVLVKQ